MTQIATIEPAQVVQQQTTQMSMVQWAIENKATPEQLVTLYELQQRVEADFARKAFNDAMAKFKQNPPRIIRNVTKQAGQMQLHYASLDSICKAVIPALSTVGVRHSWRMKQEGEVMTVTCVLAHVSGHSEETSMSAPYDKSGGKNPIQTIASAQSYLQRYTLLAACGLAAEFGDDDGDAAGGKPGMPEHDLIQYLDAIRSANSAAELKTFFGNAYKAAQACNDTVAMADIKKAYDKRKGEIQ